MTAKKEEKPKRCEWCGVTMTRRRYGDRLEGWSEFQQRKYCSLTCANSRKHPAHWGTYHWRARKLMRDKCEACGGQTSLQAHHIDQVPANNALENVQTLCKHCHDFWHTAAKRRGRTVAGRMVFLGWQ